MLLTLLILMTLFVAYANGANDNFKGMATIYGSNTLSFRTALWIGTIATLAGCVSSVFVADTLVQAFSGKGLVPDVTAASPYFLTAVAGGAASTVMLATLTGFPISTTHALTGALVGAGFVAAGSNLNIYVLGGAFFLPLLVSPLLSILLTMPLYQLAHKTATRFGISRETCVCIGARQFVPVSDLAFDAGTGSYRKVDKLARNGVEIGTTTDCVTKYSGRFLGLTTQRLVDSAHCLSAVAVSFARGLNDTPKIVGLMFAVKAFDVHVSMLAIAGTMAVGGLVNARKVAETMSKKVSRMNDGQALSANLTTAFLVIFASHLGLPVSTTHVSVGAIVGVGVVNKTADRSVIGGILLSWVLTLPIAAAVAASIFWLLRISA
jgi:PiT family inorganic phosphate transporter